MEKTSFINTVIGENTQVKGEFIVNGIIRVDGVFEGNLKTDGKVFVGITGKIKGDVNARSVIIGGQVYGTIAATEKVEILSSGNFIGEIISPRLIMEEGTYFNGYCRINKNINKSNIEIFIENSKDASKQTENHREQDKIKTASGK